MKKLQWIRGARIVRGGWTGGDPDSLLTGAVAFYRNNGTDVTGSGNHADAVLTPSTTTGLGGAANAAMLLESGEGYSRAPLITSGSFTFTGFLNTEVLTHNWLQQRDGATARQFLGLSGGSTQASASGVAEVGAGGVSPTSNTFVFTAASYDGTNLRLYTFDTLNVLTPQTANYTSLDDFLISCGSGIGEEFKLQFVGVWNRKLTDGGATIISPTVAAGSEIGRLLNNGDGFDPWA